MYVTNSKFLLRTHSLSGSLTRKLSLLKDLTRLTYFSLSYVRPSTAAPLRQHEAMKVCAFYSRVQRGFSVRAAPGAIVISAFSSLKPILSGVILRVHPDVLVGAGLDAAGAAANEASLSSLFRLFEGLRARAGDEKDAAAVGEAPLAGRYALDFWHRAPEGSRSALMRTKHAVSLTQTNEAALVELPREAARAHWLDLGLRALAPLAESTGVAARGSITLAPALESVVAFDARKAASRPSAHFARDAESALAESLLNFPPLDNEKFRAGDSGINGSPSVFSRAVREARADALLSRDGWLDVRSIPHAAAAAARLRKALVAHHDALHAYHPLWDGLQVCIARNQQWGADIEGGTLSVPEDWTDAELVRFVRGKFSSLLKESLARARTTKAKRP